MFRNRSPVKAFQDARDCLAITTGAAWEQIARFNCERKRNFLFSKHVRKISACVFEWTCGFVPQHILFHFKEVK